MFFNVLTIGLSCPFKYLFLIVAQIHDKITFIGLIDIAHNFEFFFQLSMDRVKNIYNAPDILPWKVKHNLPLGYFHSKP